MANNGNGTFVNVPGGISSEFEYDMSVDPYNYAPVSATYGVGSLNPIGYDELSYDEMPTSYEELRGAGTSTPYGYEQYLSWGPSGYMTEIVTGYDEFGNPEIVRPGSSTPLAGRDDVPGYNWDLMPQYGPFRTDSPLTHPGEGANSGEFQDLGIANIGMGIPGVILNDYQALQTGARSDPYLPQDREGYTVVDGILPAAALDGGSWVWDPNFENTGRYRPEGMSFRGEPLRYKTYGNYVWQNRHGSIIQRDQSGLRQWGIENPDKWKLRPDVSVYPRDNIHDPRLGP
jgi:hypothetical protein